MDKNFVDKPLEDQLCFELYKASNNVAKMYKYALQKHDLTFPQYLVLLALWEKEEMRIKDLQTRLDISIGTLNPILNHLEAHGWLQKRKSESDKRAVIVSLSIKAKQKREEISLNILQEIMDFQLEKVDPQNLLANLKALNYELDTLEEKHLKEK